jgi:tetratricopeptide (TPR) repeat protein
MQMYLIAVLYAASIAAPWTQHLNEAKKLQRNGDLARAEKEFLRAEAEARKQGTQSTAFALTLDAIGSFYDDLGNFRDAESCMMRSLTIWQKLLGPDHPALVRPVNKLAALYLETSQLDKVEKLDLEKWARRVEQALPESDDWIRTLEHLAALYSLRGDFEASRNAYQQILDRVPNRGRLGLAERAVVFNNLGLACLRFHKYSDAIRNLTAAREIWIELHGADDRDVAASGHSLAIAYHNVGRDEEALPLATAAAQSAERLFGPESFRTASTLATCGKILRKLNRKQEAKQIEARVDRIMQQAAYSTPSRHVVDVTELSFR